VQWEILTWSIWRIKGEADNMYLMDEGRKRTILIGACILVSRKFAQLGPPSSPALEAAISDAVLMAERIMQKIDSRSAVPPNQSMTSNANYPFNTRS